MKTASISTTEMAYVDRGAGLPVLLVHGYPLDHTMWAAQIDALSGRARVIAPDLRGFGRTPLGQVDPIRGVSMEQYADDLVELLDALAIREPIVLVGFSMGGYVAWQFVRKHADRLRALVACDTRAAADTEDAREGRLKMAQHVAEWGTARVAEMMGPKLLAPQSFATKRDVVEAVRRVVEGTSPAAIAAAQRGMADRPDATDLLPKIDVPTLVIVGEHDVISTQSEMESIARAIPGAGLAVISEAGHMAPMENPEKVNEALRRFLDAVGEDATARA
jgi:pimeloyl-ACP methyl ester carboxylesterase